MDQISPVAPLLAIPTPELSAGAGTSPGDPRSTDFEILVALLTETSGKAATEGDLKQGFQPEPPTVAPKTPGKKISAPAADTDQSSENALNVIASIMIDLTVNNKVTPLQALTGATIELQKESPATPPGLQPARMAPPVILYTADIGAQETTNPEKMAPAKRETILTPTSYESQSPAKPEPAKSGEPQFSLPDTQPSPVAAFEHHQQPSSTLPASPLLTAPTISHAMEFKAIASPVSGPHIMPLGRVDSSILHTDRTFVVVSTDQLQDGSFELRFDPPDLGVVRISLSPDDSGAIRALVTADRAETLDLVRRHIDVFRSEAGNHGLNNLDFRFESGSQSRNGPDSERKKPTTRLTNAFAAGFDGDTVYSGPLNGGMDVLA